MHHGMREKEENVVLEQIHRAEREAAEAKAAEEAAKNPPAGVYATFSRVVTTPVRWLGGAFKGTEASDTSSSSTESTDTEASNGNDPAADNNPADATAPNANVTDENADTPKDGTRGHVDAGPVASGSGTTSPVSPADTDMVIEFGTEGGVATATRGADGATSDLTQAGLEVVVTGGPAKFIPAVLLHDHTTTLGATVDGTEINTTPELTTTTSEADLGKVAGVAAVDADTTGVNAAATSSNKVTKTPSKTPIKPFAELTEAEHDEATKTALEDYVFPLARPNTSEANPDLPKPNTKTQNKRNKRQSKLPIPHGGPATTYPDIVAPEWTLDSDDDDEPVIKRSYTPVQKPRRAFPPPPKLPSSTLTAERDAPPTPRLRPVGRIRSASRSSVRTPIDGDDGAEEFLRKLNSWETPVDPGTRPVGRIRSASRSSVRTPIDGGGAEEFLAQLNSWDPPVVPGTRPVSPMATHFQTHRRVRALSFSENRFSLADLVANIPEDVLDRAAAYRASQMTDIGLGHPALWSQVGRLGNADQLDVPHLQIQEPTPRTEPLSVPSSPMSEIAMTEADQRWAAQGFRNTLPSRSSSLPVNDDKDQEEGTIAHAMVATRGPHVSFSSHGPRPAEGADDNDPVAPPTRLRSATFSHFTTPHRPADRLSNSEADDDESLVFIVTQAQPRARVSFPPDLVTATHPAARTSTLMSFHSEDKVWKYTFKGRVRNAFRRYRAWVKARGKEFGAWVKRMWRKWFCCAYENEDEDELDAVEQGQAQAAGASGAHQVRAAAGA